MKNDLELLHCYCPTGEANMLMFLMPQSFKSVMWEIKQYISIEPHTEDSIYQQRRMPFPILYPL